jgi:superfamily I DNA/RNA helicase
MARIAPDDWRPTGIDDLEHQAWIALRQPGSTCVIAGPGAGKTELLAQRAVYLLQTGICAPPRRVLAISYKTDAAANLAARVRQRCPPDLAARFVSITFDAFTKGLVDRFLTAIPPSWRPTRQYDIVFSTSGRVDGFLYEILRGAPVAWQAAIAQLTSQNFESRDVGSYRLPVVRTEPQNGVQYAIDRWWARQMERAERPSLTFVSLNRLAELLLRANPHILRAIRATYPFVFVDELQDTTYAQYDFLLSVFADGRTAVTAVGDAKQRIMVWAGARPDAFERFEADFNATRIPLHFNFRSSPELVRIQHVVARALDSKAVPTTAHTARMVDGDVAVVWNSETKDAEANHLAEWLAGDMEQRGKEPRDYALLVRQKADMYEDDLTGAFAESGLRIRNESRVLGRTTLQDLLADELCGIGLALLRLGSKQRAPDAWRIATSAVETLRAVDPEDEAGGHKADAELTHFVKSLRTWMETTPPAPELAVELAAHVFAFVDRIAVARTYLQYSTGDLLDIIIEAFTLHLEACANGAESWATCLDVFEGISQIPLMTVHKSKGLEYDTIVFVGLDDQAWWTYSPNNPEGLSTFFVALTRAKQRAIFAFCQERGDRRKVAQLFRLLTDGGVQEISI